MLVRAARRKAHPNAIRQTLSSEQLYLPWLYPTINVPRRNQRRIITVNATAQGHATRKRRLSNDGIITPSRRSLATAVDNFYDALPFADKAVPPAATYSGTSSLSALRPFDETPLMLGGSLAPAPVRHPNNRQGIGGEISEISSIFRACLAVGRLERAGIILKRIAKLEALSMEEIVLHHNSYLEAAVSHVLGKPGSNAMQAIHKWFELEIRNEGLDINAETVGWMLKVSLQSPRNDGDRRARLVRRYMDIGKQKALGLEVLQWPLLSAEEKNEITHICPEYNVKGPEQIEEALEVECSDAMDNAIPEIRTPVKPTPLIRPMKQKGSGLKALRQTLEPLYEDDYPDQSASMEERREAQRRLETNAVRSAIERWREESVSLAKMGMNTSLQTKSLGARMWSWQISLESALKEELVKIDEAELKEKKQNADTERCLYGPFLRLLPTDQLAAVTILSCMTLLSSTGIDKGVPLATTVLGIAENVEDEALFEKVQRNTHKLAWNALRRGKTSPMSAALLRKAKRARSTGVWADSRVSNNNAIKSIIAEESWSTSIKAKVGALLMSALIQTAKIPVTMQHQDTGEMVTQMQPAFSHSQQFRRGKRVGVIIANSILVEQLKREPVHSLLAKHLPMSVKPDPWTHFNVGGYIAHPSKVMRIKNGDKDQRHYAEAAIHKGDMTQTFKALDVLGKTAWRINQPIFDVMLEAWNSGEGIANLAPENPKLDIPSEPDTKQDPDERRKWVRAVKITENLRSGLHSLRCFQNLQLEIARALSNKEFYFPHNVDFRGRAYPIPPYLNHMGADHCRGLLIFGNGRELGESGLRWLKIHLANVFGYDKASLKEREDFATKHMPKIYECAANPLKGSKWWLNAEDPWQFLAACMELKAALESGDPTKFVSHLPIHQDGTCNGLQHYAALGGDVWGAKQVNLEPSDRPADVYSAVAELVKASIATDKERGNPYAEVLHGKITRKIVKQTVMTNVYGVTYIGAKAQVRKALVATHKDLPNEENMHSGILSSYIATKIFTALATMFRGAHDIQHWLGECASRITQAVTSEQIDGMEADPLPKIKTNSSRKTVPWKFDSSAQFKSAVIWTTPLHMPVVQPYRSSKTKTVLTNLQRISISEPHRSHPVSRRKQLQGFPPNFIHSLDATHMLLSALQCDELGLSFAAVHDSFWTHASDVDAMNGVLRDTFIRIHSEDVIGRLAAEFTARYRGYMYLAKVRPNTPLFDKIAALRQARRKAGSMPSKLNELLSERKRWQLLNSADPEEVEEGKTMVTPGSLFEELSSEDDLADEPELSDLGIGEISSREARLSMDQEIEVGDSSNISEINNPLPGGTPADLAMGMNAEDSLELVEDAEALDEVTSTFARAAVPTAKPKTRKATGWVWLPLTFPPVPKKGEFDVSRLKGSDYFFS